MSASICNGKDDGGLVGGAVMSTGFIQMTNRLPIATVKQIYAAVFWFGSQEYGGLHHCKTWEDAESQAALLKRVGYDDPGICEVRIIQTVEKTYRP
jgi:hypothetical protein